MRSLNNQDTAHLPDGRVDVTGLLYGCVGLVLSFALYWIGVFKRADAWLLDMLHKPLFQSGAPELPSPLFLILSSTLFCFGVAFAVLDSASLWRRVVLGVTALVLTFAMVPTWAVWNIYFSPFVQAIAVFWSWFCVVIYTQHHRMPCDPVYAEVQISKPEPELLQPVDKPVVEPVVIEHPHEIIGLPETPEEKYKPKADEGETQKLPGVNKSPKRKQPKRKRKRR